MDYITGTEGSYGALISEIWENPIKSHGYWHFGHGDFIFHNEPNVYLALILFFSPMDIGILVMEILFFIMSQMFI
jgi:hypothetical protein